ncbi:hypothetical protein GZ78_07715 [Endozoicomonas numazuensis]|uniref:Uncharacterized protein n=1 Tax=Endozoicomonas numazuensis TaxID=1137799 RepID=A0A081NMS2_9GAMM|nr:hypothetical protein GZ78_07715 [Endozoicomonas numazuensis]
MQRALDQKFNANKTQRALIMLQRLRQVLTGLKHPLHVLHIFPIDGEVRKQEVVALLKRSREFMNV